MREGVAVGVANGYVLEEGEVGGAVEEGKGWEFHGVDGDLWVLWAEEYEASDYSSDAEDDQERGC